MALILLFFNTPRHAIPAKATAKELALTFDLPGMSLMLGAFTCLFLALQDGGITASWGSSAPIGLLVGQVLLVIAFVVVEWKQGERVMIVGRIMKPRSILVCFHLLALAHVDQEHQTDRVHATQQIFGLISSAAVGKVGYYQPFLFAGALFITVGSGMIYTLEITSTAAQYISYQVLAGIGMGLVI
ncbi:hypothetical protein MMC30_008278 [Trapelia coarctata]|nr:hypothetical protein [Trapelia coarctata]